MKQIKQILKLTCLAFLLQYSLEKDDLQAEFYMRMMGNEMYFRSVDGSVVKKLRDGRGSAFFDDLMKKLMKDGSYSYTQSASVLDSTMIIPTGM